MPVTVVSGPLPRVGPGVGFIVRTDFVGPFLTGTTWRIEIHPDGDELNLGCVVTAPLWSADQHERRIWIEADPDGGQQTLYGRYTTLGQGATVDVFMQLIAPDGETVIDSGTVSNILWDTVSSASRLLPQAQTGLAAEQQEQLNAVQAAVTMSFPGLPTFGLSDLFALLGPIVHPPAGFQVRELIGDFDGNNTFTRPGGGFGVNAFGITWEVQTYGGGIGLDTGTPVRFETDLLEISIEHTDHDGHDFVSAAERFDYSNKYYYFDPMFPTRVNVVIAPSVTIRFYWLLATFP